MYHQEDNTITTKETVPNEKLIGGVGYVCFNYMKKHGNNIAQIDAITGETNTYEALLIKCIRTSIALQKKGISKGDVITYLSDIHLNACVPITASFFMGAIPSFLDTVLPLTETISLLEQVKPKFLLTSPQFAEKIKSIIENTDTNTEIVIFDESFFSYQEEEGNFEPIYVNDLDEVASIYFSSGSSGLSKGICLNHYSMLYNDVMEEESLWKENETMTLLSFDSFYWTAEMIRFVSAIRQGACRLVSPQESDGSNIWHLLEKYKVNVAYLIPYDITKMCNSGKPKDINVNSLTTIVAEGASLLVKYQQALQELLPNVDIFQVYGQTEVGVLTRFYKDGPYKEFNRTKTGSVGHPVLGLGISFRVVDLKTGKNLGPNQTGELRVKSKTIMKGYYNMDSSSQFDENGWLKTGDAVYYDENYYFYVVSRIKDVIICQGWHVTPASVEAELLTHPNVKKAAVIGVPHDQDGELPLGAVILDNDVSDVTARDIESYIRAKFPHRSMLKVKIVERIPLTASGKVKRDELKEYILSHKI